jgi:endonuclease/exonuclease/phosphatase family metal-dependent hydrolase
MTTGSGSPDGASGSTAFRVATYNLYLGADLGLVLGTWEPDEIQPRLGEVLRQIEATAFPKRVDALAALIVRERVDLVGLQEVCTWAADGATLWDFQADLLAALETAGEAYDVVVEQSTFRGTGAVTPEGRDPVSLHLAGSNVILRRRTSPVVVLATDSGIFDEALTLPALGQGEVAITRGWCRAQCLVDDHHLDFVNTHTEAHDQRSREGQRDELLRALSARSVPVVLVGDFNSPPHEIGMPDHFADAWVVAGHVADGPEAGTYGQQPDLTNVESTLHERIDYVWVRDLAVRSCRRIGDHPDDRSAAGLWPSDHAGVVAELALP